MNFGGRGVGRMGFKFLRSLVSFDFFSFFSFYFHFVCSWGLSGDGLANGVGGWSEFVSAGGVMYLPRNLSSYPTPVPGRS